jgi:transcriptional regulator with XRE-family HTH domain
MITFAQILGSNLEYSPHTISEICKRAKISRPTFYDLLKGKNLPRETTLDRLIKALEVSNKKAELLKEGWISEQFKTKRKLRYSYQKEQKNLTKEIASILLAKGHEVSKPNAPIGPDLVIRQGDQKIPIMVYWEVFDYATALGSILIIMDRLGAIKGYLCTPKSSQESKANSTLFNRYSVTITSAKRLLHYL